MDLRKMNDTCVQDPFSTPFIYEVLENVGRQEAYSFKDGFSGYHQIKIALEDKSKMNFGSGGNSKAKAWRDIWGAGQGVGQIFDAPPAAEIVARLKAEYDAARAALFAGETVPTQLKQAAE